MSAIRAATLRRLRATILTADNPRAAARDYRDARRKAPFGVWLWSRLLDMRRYDREQVAVLHAADMEQRWEAQQELAWARRYR